MSEQERARERVERLRARVRTGLLLGRINLGVAVLLLVSQAGRGVPTAIAALAAALAWLVAWPLLLPAVARALGRAEERIAPDPSRGWVRTVAVPTADLDRPALEGVALGEPIAGLAGLGPADDPRAARLGVLRWRALGVAADEGEGRLEAFRLSWADGFSGRVRLDGRDLALGAGSDEAAVVAALGAPYWRDPDPDELLLFYERADGVEWQVELAGGRLSGWLVRRPPLLADPEQRRAYGVDRPWPPA